MQPLEKSPLSPSPTQAVIALPPPPQPPPPPPLPTSSSILNIAIATSSGTYNNAGQDSSKLHSSEKKGIVHEDINLMTVKEQAKKAFQIFAKDKCLTEAQFKDYVILSSYCPVKPVIQNGPLCGIVALAMAADLLGNPVSTEEIYKEAVKKGFSLQGEIFSANYMKSLAASFLETFVVSQRLEGSIEENVSTVVKSLLKNNRILFPYDADKNHGPCQAKGHKAHWGLIVGYFIVYNKNDMDSSLTSKLQSRHFTADSDFDYLYYRDGFQNDLTESELDYLVNNIINVKVFVHQGKSKYCGIWDLVAMLNSNKNLIELGPDRNTTEYKIPDGGVRDGLCSQAVLIGS